MCNLWKEIMSLQFIFLFSTYGDPIPVKELADRVASYVHLCTLYWWLRFNEIPLCFADLFYFAFPIILIYQENDIVAADLLDVASY